MNILYLSCHTILEYDEIKLFTELGHNVFSMGAYQTTNADNGTRPAIDGLYHNDHLLNVSLQCSKENIHPELIDWADVIISMHNARVSVEDHPQPWIANNWKKFKVANKPVVWRSIGQSTQQIEQAIKPFRADGLKIVRYSPKEANIPDYQGEDAMIRFYKDPDEYRGFTGEIPQIVNISQALYGGEKVRSRGDHMSLDLFQQVLAGFDWKVFGPDNENAGDHNGGSLSFPDLKEMLKLNRVYFYTGTRPASYTLALIEAMMTGIPIVAIGPDHGNMIYNQDTYEAHEIIKQGDSGFFADNNLDLREMLRKLVSEQAMAVRMGQNGRERAIELFGKATISAQWKKFLDQYETTKEIKD